MRTQTTTYEVRLERGPHESALTDIAEHMSVSERRLHAKLSKMYREAESNNWPDDQLRDAKNTLKRVSLTELGITGRQYNALFRGLEGRYKSLNELAKLRVEKTRHQTKKLISKIRKREATLTKSATASLAINERERDGKAPTKAQLKSRKSKVEIGKLKFANHGQKRRLAILESRVAKDLIICDAKVPSVVFGSKSLLNQRSLIHGNDVQSIEAWQDKWERARSSQFLVVGSKKETAGCQSCVLRRSDASMMLSLRAPNALKEHLGLHVSIPLTGVSERARETIKNTLNAHQNAMSAHEDEPDERVSIGYRFVRDEKWHARKRLSAWKVFITIDRKIEEVKVPAFIKEYGGSGQIFIKDTTDAFCGALGVDLNADHLAYAAIDRDGNPIRSRSGRINLPIRNKTSEQRKAIIGDAIAEITRLASQWHLPIVIEKLDFKAKKRDLKSEHRIEYRRMLSSLSYSMIQTMLRRRAERDCVEIVEVNPAYTSTIGRVNYARRYGLSVHISAAVAIARRSARMSERVNYVNGHRGLRNALPAPVEARKHVWRQWAQIRKDLAQRDTDDYRLAAGITSSVRSLKGRNEMSASSG